MPSNGPDSERLTLLSDQAVGCPPARDPDRTLAGVGCPGGESARKLSSRISKSYPHDAVTECAESLSRARHGRRQPEPGPVTGPGRNRRRRPGPGLVVMIMESESSNGIGT